MSLDTTNWVKFPVSVDGVDFVSVIDPTALSIRKLLQCLMRYQ